MIPAPFDYVRAGSVDEAIGALPQIADAKLLAGGHSLLPAMRLRVARPSTLVDIGRLADLSYVREDGDAIAIGALTRHHDVANSEVLQAALPDRAVRGRRRSATRGPPPRHHRRVGRPRRSRGRPADASCSRSTRRSSRPGPGGATRTIAASDFFTGLFETALAHDEVLTEIRVPKSAAGWSFLKFNRRAQDWALVGVAAVRSNGGVHVALTNMGLTPLRASAVEEAVAGGADPASAASHAAEGTAPPDDAFASSEYRRALSAVLVERALREAMG